MKPSNFLMAEPPFLACAQQRYAGLLNLFTFTWPSDARRFGGLGGNRRCSTDAVKIVREPLRIASNGLDAVKNSLGTLQQLANLTSATIEF